MSRLRTSFKFPLRLGNTNWYPGHMNKGLRQMQHALGKADCIIEVHDARIPISGRNNSFKHQVLDQYKEAIAIAFIFYESTYTVQ